MKSSTLVLVVLCITIIFLLATFHNTAIHGIHTDSHTAGATDIERMIRVIRIQNETIHALTSHMDTAAGSGSTTNTLLKIIQEKETQISLLSEELQSIQTQGKTAPQDPTDVHIPTSHTEKAGLRSADSFQQAHAGYALDVPPAKLEAECESFYGMQLVDNWRKTEQTWCSTDEGAPVQSTLKCYPYTQHHKKTPDMFCEASNFIIDFSKLSLCPPILPTNASITQISGEHGTTKPTRGDQYLKFGPDSLLSACKKTDRFKSAYFMPHHQLQMAKFRAEVPQPSISSIDTVDTPLYLLARDEDCENSFHSTADFMNMFVVLSVLNIKPDDIQVMLFDKHTDGPYYDLIRRAYSPRHELLRHGHFQKKKVMFKRLIFHLESPAGLIFPKVANPDPLKCLSTGLFQAYRKHVLHSFGLWDVAPPPIPSITLSLRHRTPQKNVGRVMANEEEVVAAVRAINMANVQIVDTARMKFEDQLKLIRSTNVLVGIHGAGLMFIMFAAEEAVLVEIHPSYRQDRHFRHASRMTGKIYMPVRSVTRETCQGSSDNVMVPMEEFRRALDGAVRVARNFDDGISECGMTCPAGILALDKRLHDHYKPGEARGPPVNTQFPCH